MKPVPQFLQDTMDRLKKIEYDLSRSADDKVGRTAAACFGGLIDNYHRSMLNNHGIDIPILSDAHFDKLTEEPQMDPVPEVISDPAPTESTPVGIPPIDEVSE